MDNTNEHSFEGIFSQSHDPIFSLVGENQEMSEVFMGGFGKSLPFEDSNSSESITSSYITCLPTIKHGKTGQNFLIRPDPKNT